MTVNRWNRRCGGAVRLIHNPQYLRACHLGCSDVCRSWIGGWGLVSLGDKPFVQAGTFRHIAKFLRIHLGLFTTFRREGASDFLTDCSSGTAGILKGDVGLRSYRKTQKRCGSIEGDEGTVFDIDTSVR